MTDKPYRYWSTGLMEAVHSENHTVELVAGERGGAQVEIDGVRMFDGEGYPMESFNLATSKYQNVLTEQGMEKLRAVSQEDSTQ